MVSHWSFYGLQDSKPELIFFEKPLQRANCCVGSLKEARHPGLARPGLAVFPGIKERFCSQTRETSRLNNGLRLDFCTHTLKPLARGDLIQGRGLDLGPSPENRTRVSAPSEP